MKNFEDLVIWKVGFKLSKEIYKQTRNFPREEIYGLTSQMRRCAVSIPSNIAEGCGRKTQKEFLQFLHIAFGSLKELECQLMISRDLKFMTIQSFESIHELTQSLSKMMSILIIKVRKELI